MRNLNPISFNSITNRPILEKINVRNRIGLGKTTDLVNAKNKGLFILKPLMHSLHRIVRINSPSWPSGFDGLFIELNHLLCSRQLERDARLEKKTKTEDGFKERNTISSRQSRFEKKMPGSVTKVFKMDNKDPSFGFGSLLSRKDGRLKGTKSFKGNYLSAKHT